jgi:hypothetical protein
MRSEQGIAGKGDQLVKIFWQKNGGETLGWKHHCGKDRLSFGSTVAKRATGLLATLWERRIKAGSIVAKTEQLRGKES